MRVVLDTNIYISAILFGGNCEEILRLALLGAFEILISKDILREVDYILKDKFKWSKRQVKEVNSYINDLSILIKPDVSLSVVLNDPSDNKIIECAVSGKAHCIVSGDSHILDLKKFKGIKILSPAEFLRL